MIQLDSMLRRDTEPDSSVALASDQAATAVVGRARILGTILPVKCDP